MLLTLFSAVFTRAPNQLQATSMTEPACASGVGVGGVNNTNASQNIGGHGCVVIKYRNNASAHFETFNYTGSTQSWTVPDSVTSVTFFLLGAGGGGVPISGNYGDGGGGGYATGSYVVTPGQVLTVIVGQAGGGEMLKLVSGTGINGCYRGTATFGGGGRGGSCWAGYSYADRASSGGGRTAIRLSNTEEIATAAGGGGGGWSGNGGHGGGITGANSGDATGGTQSTGGTTANALATTGNNSPPAMVTTRAAEVEAATSVVAEAIPCREVPAAQATFPC